MEIQNALMPKNVFLGMLAKYGITFTNRDPYRYYELGKTIINKVNPSRDPDIYDYYNSINRHVLDIALENMDKRYKNANLQNSNI